MKFLILVYWEKGEDTFAMTYKSICRFLEKFHDATNEVTLHVGLGSCMNLFGKGKGVFFSESAIRFSDLQISKKKIFQKTILSLKFKFQAQDSFLEYFFFWDLEIWKTNRTFWKKNTFTFAKQVHATPQADMQSDFICCVMEFLQKPADAFIGHSKGIFTLFSVDQN